VFIGDTSVDVRCGQEAGIETLVVSNGPYWYQSPRTPVKEGNALGSIRDWPLWYDLHIE